MDFENRNDHLLDIHHIRSGEADELSVEELLDSLVHEVSEPVTAVILNAMAVKQALAMDPPDLAIAESAVRCLIRDCRDISEMVTLLTTLFRGVTDKGAYGSRNVMDRAQNCIQAALRTR